MAGEFRVEPEQLPQVIKDLEEAQRHVQTLRREAQMISGNELSGSVDGVTVNAQEQLRALATDSKADGLAATLQAYMEQLDQSIRNFTDMMHEYRVTEDLNTLEPSKLKL